MTTSRTSFLLSLAGEWWLRSLVFLFIYFLLHHYRLLFAVVVVFFFRSLTGASSIEFVFIFFDFLVFPLFVCFQRFFFFWSKLAAATSLRSVDCGVCVCVCEVKNQRWRRTFFFVGWNLFIAWSEREREKKRQK